MSTAGISWKRILVEGSAIVASILLAFAIDAAWEDRQERRSDLELLESVHDELLAHRVLLEEAMAAHGVTVQSVWRLMEILAAEPSVERQAETAEQLNAAIAFYNINAPFGSLQTAMTAGALARMKDKQLASALAGWPTSIDDLLEEQVIGANLRNSFYNEVIVDLAPLHEVYRHKLLRPVVRGTDVAFPGVAVERMPPAHAETDFSRLHKNQHVTNRLFYLMLIGQSSHAEAGLAAEKLIAITDSLAACLDEQQC